MMANFFHIRLELAREPEHPSGDPRDGWDIVAPLDAEGRLDLEAFHGDPQRCFVRRFIGGETIAKGHLRHSFGDRWLFDMDVRDDLDATGFKLGDERFVLGEYVSTKAGDGDAHTFRVQQVEPIRAGVQDRRSAD